MVITISIIFSLLSKLIIFLLELGVLVFVHEFGHFIMAKRAGVKVEEFGFGFPPKIFGIRRGETEYTINFIPLGGFVKILGENGEDKNNPRSFSSKPAWARFKMLAAGVVANILLAAALFGIAAFIGVPTIAGDRGMDKNIHDIHTMILDVANNSPAKNAGVMAGDIIVSLASGGQKIPVSHSVDVENFIKDHKGKEITFEIRRRNETKSITAEARTNAPSDQGATGITLAEVGTVSYPWYMAIWQGIMRTGEVIMLTFAALLGLLKSWISTGHVSGQLSGPYGIAVMSVQMAELGWAYTLQFIALLSVNLAIINALPFPALDGGRILFLGIEKIKEKPVSQETENTIHTIGFIFLLLLMVLVTFRDFRTYDVWDKLRKIF